MGGESSTPTPWAVRCYFCEPEGGHLVYLDREEYIAQLSRPDSRWSCPRCGETAPWDDANYDLRCDEVEEEEIDDS